MKISKQELTRLTSHVQADISYGIDGSFTKSGKDGEPEIDHKEAKLVLNTLDKLRKNQNNKIEYGCVHARPVGQPCPHCLGLNDHSSIDMGTLTTSE